MQVTPDTQGDRYDSRREAGELGAEFFGQDSVEIGPVEAVLGV